MAKASGSQPDSADMRVRLIEGAISILERSGADRLSMRALAKEADASVSAANYSFGGRQGLIEAAFQAVLDRALAWWRAQTVTAAPTDDPQARAAALTALLLKAIHDDRLPKAAFQEVVLAASRDDEVRAMLGAYRRAAEDVWKTLAERLGFTPEQAPLLRLYAQGVLAVHGHWAGWVLHGPWLMDINRRLMLRCSGVLNDLPGWGEWAEQLRLKQASSQLQAYLDYPTPAAERILSASAAIIADQGLEALTHRAVAEAVDCTAANVVYHFPSRDVLVDQAFAHVFRNVLADGALDLDRVDPSVLRRSVRIESAIDQIVRADGELDPRQIPVLGLSLEALRRPQMRSLAILLYLGAEIAIEDSLRGLEGSGDPAGALESHIMLMIINGGIQDSLSTPAPERRAIWRRNLAVLLDVLFGAEDR